MRTLRRQPSMEDLGGSRGLHVELDRACPKRVGEEKMGKARDWVKREISGGQVNKVKQMVSRWIQSELVESDLRVQDHEQISPRTTTSQCPARKSGTRAFISATNEDFPTSTSCKARREMIAFDSGERHVLEDAAKRLNRDLDKSERNSVIRRNMRLKRKDSDSRRRPRSQSLSSKFPQDRGISPPAPTLYRDERSYGYEADPARGTQIGDLPMDLGGRYSSSFFPASPQSGDTSLYPPSSPSSGFLTIGPAENGPRASGWSHHPALTTSSGPSLNSISPLGVDHTSIYTPSLPASLKANAIDLTETGWKMSARFPEPGSKLPLASAASTPTVSTRIASVQGGLGTGTRSFALAQNTFYLPPLHPKPALRASKSLGPGSLRRAFTSGNTHTETKSVATSPTISYKRFKPDLAIPTTAALGSTSGNKAKRAVTVFSLCSPTDAIEPLPRAYVPKIEPPRLRSKSSSPFLTANASLRVFLGKAKDGFTSRSLSRAFENGSPEQQPSGGLKSKISAPLNLLSHRSRKGTERSKTKGAPTEIRETEKEWREHVLTQAVSLSMSSGINRLARPIDPVEKKDVVDTLPEMPTRKCKPRLAIPAELLSAVPINMSVGLDQFERRVDIARGQEGSRGTGGAMLKHGPSDLVDSGMAEARKTELMPPPRPILDALVRRDEENEKVGRMEEHIIKVLTWRVGVGEVEVGIDQVGAMHQARLSEDLKEVSNFAVSY